MKTTNLIFSSILASFLFLSPLAAQQSSRWKHVVIGAEGASYMPIGTLKDRFKSTFGEAFYAGLETSDKWTWLGKAEYMKFDKVNPDRLRLERTVNIDGQDQKVSFPMDRLKMKLEVVSLSLDTKYNLLRTGFLETNLDAGFGFYRWIFHRDGLDSLSAEVTGANGTGKTVYYSMKKAIAISQEDWSGGFNVGLEVTLTPFYPVSLSFSAAYKNIVGELYPALELEMENVSTFQMFDLKAGLRIKL
ncbi:MAG: hypothetical protein HF314_16635 [Ignavibacteria bacterium]|jgi:hypothetical protein|nr:hypothetical protein [Ignavibacteria bacterium]MCU7504711.1 hypothetical protein [Ignavibacteria bacterium]MCU7516313.1 hypothetical protein [Ignavibacteria bacterium]